MSIMLHITRRPYDYIITMDDWTRGTFENVLHTYYMRIIGTLCTCTKFIFIFLHNI